MAKATKSATKGRAKRSKARGRSAEWVPEGCTAAYAEWIRSPWAPQTLPFIVGSAPGSYLHAQWDKPEPDFRRFDWTLRDVEIARHVLLKRQEIIVPCRPDMIAFVVARVVSAIGFPCRCYWNRDLGVLSFNTFPEDMHLYAEDDEREDWPEYRPATVRSIRSIPLNRDEGDEHEHNGTED
jgi:hypothetical protein